MSLLRIIQLNSWITFRNYLWHIENWRILAIVQTKKRKEICSNNIEIFFSYQFSYKIIMLVKFFQTNAINKVLESNERWKVSEHSYDNIWTPLTTLQTNNRVASFQSDRDTTQWMTVILFLIEKRNDNKLNTFLNNLNSKTFIVVHFWNRWRFRHPFVRRHFRIDSDI